MVYCLLINYCYIIGHFNSMAVNIKSVDIYRHSNSVNFPPETFESRKLKEL